MKPAVSKKYCRTDIWLSCRHTEGSALLSATSSSRQGSALQSIWIWVLICWQLHLQVLREGLWGKSCCCWMGSVWGDKAQERKRIHPFNVCDKAFKSLQIASQHKIWQHTGNVFACRVVARSSTPTTASTDIISLCVASLTTGRVFPTSPCGARTTIEEIILNLNVWREEERNWTVLASSRKRAAILYPLQWKSIVLVFNKFVCVIFSFFYGVSQHFWRKLIINVASKKHYFFMKKIFIFEIPVIRKVLNVSPPPTFW